MIHIFIVKCYLYFLFILIIRSTTLFLLFLLFTRYFDTLAGFWVLWLSCTDKLVLVALLEDVNENLLETEVGFGGSLVVVDAVLLSQLFGFFPSDLAIICQVDFVAHEHAGGVLGSMSVDGLDPVAHILEGLFVRDVERNDHSICTTIK